MTASKAAKKKPKKVSAKPMAVPETLLLCNGAKKVGRKKPCQEVTELRHRKVKGGPAPDVRIKLAEFVGDHIGSNLPPRVLDLLEIAAYTYAGDRRVGRGNRDDLNQNRWGRRLHFLLPVRDLAFWEQPLVRSHLANLLAFISGDREITYSFEQAATEIPISLFDVADVEPPAGGEPKVMLFSGGLDSLSGAVELLTTTDNPLVLVSHRSSDSSHTRRVQDSLIQELKKRHPGRISQYAYRCGLSGGQAAEETQRTRGFLYAAVALAVASSLGQDRFYVHENGVTAINLTARADMENGRMSRTVHPKAITGLGKLFELVRDGSRFDIETPFLWRTKTEVVGRLHELGASELYRMSFSCGSARDGTSLHQHCGRCSQCVDRRFAAFAAGIGDTDEGGEYRYDFLKDLGDETGHVRGGLIDFLRDAHGFCKKDEDFDAFYLSDRLIDLETLSGHMGGGEEEAEIRRVYELHRRHGEQVFRGLASMRDRDSLLDRPSNSLISTVIGGRQYLGGRPDYAALKDRLRNLEPGNATAGAYEDLVQQILAVVFDPHLVDPEPQRHTDGSLRRVDIVFTNRQTGFFGTVKSQWPKCLTVLFECKNYSSDLGKPEFNQMKATLGKRAKTQVGFIVCRKTNRTKALQESISEASDNLMMLLDDTDLLHLLDCKSQGNEDGIVRHLEKQMRSITLGA